jgi:hypothetical protein
MPATIQLQASLRALFTKTGTLAGPQVEYLINLAASVASGTLDGQADKAWGKTAAIAAVDDIDLIGTAPKDDFGDNLGFVEVCGVFVYADAANPGNILVGAATVSTAVLGVGAATHVRVVKPGAFDFWYAPTGWPVATGTTDLLRIDRSTGTCTYSIIIIGRSA